MTVGHSLPEKQMFSDKELERYSRNFLVSGWGLETQKKLKSTQVFMDTFNDTCARYLIAAGIESLLIKGITEEEENSLTQFRSKVNLSPDKDPSLIDVEIYFKKNIKMCAPGIIVKDKKITFSPESFFDSGDVSIGINLALLAIKHLFTRLNN